jgi:hypothetical protein
MAMIRETGGASAGGGRCLREGPKMQGAKAVHTLVSLGMAGKQLPLSCPKLRAVAEQRCTRTRYVVGT